MTYDVITLGETMLRLTPPEYQRLEQGHNYQVHVGGSESNTAVGLTRLGLKVAHITRLTDNALGALIQNTLRAQGVDMQYTLLTDQDRIGLYFLEEAQLPRAAQVIYDRADSAMSRIQPADLPPIFTPNRAKLLHLSGITLAISPNAAETANIAIREAKAAGWKISFDLNYRAKLWTYPQALAQSTEALENADLLYFPIRDALQLFALPAQAQPEKVAAFIAKRYPQAHIVLTLGADGAACQTATGAYHHQSAFPVETQIGRIGGGDAFTAGFLYGYLTTDDLPTALQWGSATAAMKYTLPGDMPLINRNAIAALIKNSAFNPLHR
jgi:2-dehydro-3-deoxygluconokinase